MAHKLYDPRIVVAAQERGTLDREVGVGPNGVPQVDEEQATVVALGRQPSRQADLGADIFGAQGATTGVAVPVGHKGSGRLW
jgi:hypothetical protein